jgi:hypothetical protein
MRAAAALYGQAAVTTVTPKILAYVTQGMTPDAVDEVIAAVAEVARVEKNETVLRRIRQAGLNRLAAEGLEAELSRRMADGVPPGELDQFLDDAFQATQGGESARREVLDYIDGGGGNLFDLARLLVAKMPADALPVFVPLRGRSFAEIERGRVVTSLSAATCEHRPRAGHEQYQPRAGS